MATKETKETKETKAKAKAEDKFTKAQLYASKRFADEKDLISALLIDGMTYSIDEVSSKIKEFKEKAVD